VRDGALAPWRTLVTFGPDDAFTDPIAFSADDRSLYAIDAKDSPTARLVRYDLATGAAEPLAADPSSDVTSAFVDPRTHNVVAAAVERERVEWTVTDPNYAADFAALGHVRAGGIEIPSASADGRTWIVGFSTDDGAEAYYSYDRTTKAAAPLFFSAPELAGLALSRMQPISLLARDGLQLHGYLTLPAGVDPRGLPTVLLVHGGPWARDRFGYSGIVQWLANRGYAVLQVNFRGSTGYGRAFENAGDRQWAGGMRTDLLDARDWVVKAGFADPARVAIVGESYGGYAVLAALATTPSAFACGVDIAGLSDLGSVSAAVAKEPSAVRDIYARRMGDDAAALRAESPLYLAANISAPLLVGQGQNDLRVPIRNTDRLVATVRAKKIPVSYVVFPDEGHGFVHPANNLRFNALLEEFLARYLGGRAERAHAGEALDSLMR
jgi:dipeptidyl aminopeptidase/acylaminoacyl peptidase